MEDAHCGEYVKKEKDPKMFNENEEKEHKFSPQQRKKRNVCVKDSNKKPKC